MALRALSALLLGMLLAGCATPQGCHVETVADLPLLPHVGITAVKASLEGQDVALIIDTGAFISTVSRNGARHFGLQPSADAGVTFLRGIGGVTAAPTVTVHGLGLGRGIARSVDLPVATDFPRPVDGLPVVGLFGNDFLSNYDVDVDVPRQHFGLYRATGCDAAMQPFDPPYFAVPFSEDKGQVVLRIRLNNRPMAAILDTGASLTLIDRDEALAAGVTLDGLDTDQIRTMDGVDLHRVAVRRHQFGSLEVGDERMNNFHFLVAPVATGRTLLGRDFLRFNRVLISHSRHMVFIQPVAAGPPAG